MAHPQNGLNFPQSIHKLNLHRAELEIAEAQHKAIQAQTKLKNDLCRLQMLLLHKQACVNPYRLSPYVSALQKNTELLYDEFDSFHEEINRTPLISSLIRRLAPSLPQSITYSKNE